MKESPRLRPLLRSSSWDGKAEPRRRPADTTGAKLPGRADKLMARGSEKLQQGEAQEAEALFRQALATDTQAVAQ